MKCPMHKENLYEYALKFYSLEVNLKGNSQK